jgi:chemotaxis protein CheD
MHKVFIKDFHRQCFILTPGEYYATGDDIVLTTLVGSCVSACLYDQIQKIIGMNHFLLSRFVQPEQVFHSVTGRYGIHAMELLINGMMKLGANRKNFKAKAFGGAHVLKKNNGVFSSVPDANVQFIKAFLETENIPLVSSNLGGHTGRKIYFVNNVFKVYVRMLDSVTGEQTIEQEKSHWRKTRSRIMKPVSSDVNIFNGSKSG